MGSKPFSGLCVRLAVLFSLCICILLPVLGGETSLPNLRGTATASGAPKLAFNPSPAPFVSSGFIISEFRLRGPNGANDEFIELYNTSTSPLTISASPTGTGYGVAASDGVLRCSIPNGTVIPGRGHFLCTNSIGYSYGAYPEGNGTTATGDATYALDIPDNAGIALFTSNVIVNFTLANRLDAVGSTSEANTLYKEGTGYPAITPFSIEYSFVRDNCGKHGINSVGTPCTSPGIPIDTDNNSNDFYFTDTNGTSAGAGQRLAAPGPETLSAPITRSGIFPVLIDSSIAPPFPPNRVRDFTSNPANNSTFGTLDIRRRFVNSTGASVTRLRFRIIDITTFPSASGTADLRPITSTAVVVSGINDAGTCGVSPTPCVITVQGTTLETAAAGQPNGGGWNSSMGASTVTLGTPLANGASINLRFLMGVQQTGNFSFLVSIEALP